MLCKEQRLRCVKSPYCIVNSIDVQHQNEINRELWGEVLEQAAEGPSSDACPEPTLMFQNPKRKRRTSRKPKKKRTRMNGLLDLLLHLVQEPKRRVDWRHLRDISQWYRLCLEVWRRPTSSSCGKSREQTRKTYRAVDRKSCIMSFQRGKPVQRGSWEVRPPTTLGLLQKGLGQLFLVRMTGVPRCVYRASSFTSQLTSAAQGRRCGDFSRH